VHFNVKKPILVVPKHNYLRLAGWNCVRKPRPLRWIEEETKIDLGTIAGLCCKINSERAFSLISGLVA